jgi:hypothetical protein
MAVTVDSGSGKDSGRKIREFRSTNYRGEPKDRNRSKLDWNTNGLTFW